MMSRPFLLSALIGATSLIQPAFAQEAETGEETSEATETEDRLTRAELRAEIQALVAEQGYDPTALQAMFDELGIEGRFADRMVNLFADIESGERDAPDPDGERPERPNRPDRGNGNSGPAGHGGSHGSDDGGEVAEEE